jgi:hypothetical protein
MTRRYFDWGLAIVTLGGIAVIIIAAGRHW